MIMTTKNEEIIKNFVVKMYQKEVITKIQAEKLKNKLDIVNIIELSKEANIDPNEYFKQTLKEIQKYLSKYRKIMKSEITEKNIIKLEKYEYHLIAKLARIYPKILLILQEIVILYNDNGGGNTIGARVPQR